MLSLLSKLFGWITPDKNPFKSMTVWAAIASLIGLGALIVNVIKGVASVADLQAYIEAHGEETVSAILILVGAIATLFGRRRVGKQVAGQ